MITLKQSTNGEISITRNGNIKVTSFNKVELDYLINYLLDKYQSKSYRLNNYTLEIVHPNITEELFNLKLDLVNVGKYSPSNNIIQYLTQLATGIYTTYYQNN